MKLSNFDWTDKHSVRWFILSARGHLGPYSLENLLELRKLKKLSVNSKIWAEGLSGPLSLEEVVELSKPQDPAPHEIEIIDNLASEKKMEEKSEVAAPSPAPDPVSGPASASAPAPEEVPPLPAEIFEDKSITNQESHDSMRMSSYVMRFRASLGVLLGLGLVTIILTFLLKSYEHLNISRKTKMSLELYDKIIGDNLFKKWDEEVSFKTYISDDHQQIWLVNSGFQDCLVSANFKSLKDSLLSKKEEMVHFSSSGRLKDHVVEFSSFDFLNGRRIVPGYYEMEIGLTECKWDGFVPNLMNGFSRPITDLKKEMKILLFSKSKQEFDAVFMRLQQEKRRNLLKAKDTEKIFWQDVQQRLSTLSAVTSQIQQLFSTFLKKNPHRFKVNLKQLTTQYMRHYGTFLTSFVVENEDQFKTLKKKKGSSIKKNYEFLIERISTKVGFESMKLIEEFQKIKDPPSVKFLDDKETTILLIFKKIQQEITQKQLQVSGHLNETLEKSPLN